jgi:alpha-mannosidase
LYRNEPWAEVLITTIWNARHALLKCNVKNATGFDSRVDGIPGSFQQRPLDGSEFPFHDWTMLNIKNTNDKLALISPDVFGLDCESQIMALTLLRSPVYAHDLGTKLNPNWEYDYTDQGRHDFRMLIYLGEKITTEEVSKISRQIQQPPVIWDLPWQY